MVDEDSLNTDIEVIEENLQGESDDDDDRPAILPVKKDSTADLLLIMTDRVKVKFKNKDQYETLTGRWC